MENNNLNSEFILEKEIVINKIPAILLKPKIEKEKLPTIIFYHGWSSRKEFQRIRGYLLATMGYQVVIPDAIHHGERNALDIYDMENAKKYFWETILKNLEESKFIIEEIIENYNGDSKNIGVMGNSMGGLTAAGVFTHNDLLNSLVVLNGSCDWMKYNHILSEEGFAGRDLEDFKKYEKEIELKDPVNNLGKLQDRPILMLHGTMDSLVPIRGQESFYEKARPIFSDPNKLRLIKYNNLNHFVTTNMMEESINWFKKHRI